MQALLALVGVVAAGALIKSGIRWFFRERPKRSAPADPETRPAGGRRPPKTRKARR